MTINGFDIFISRKKLKTLISNLLIITFVGWFIHPNQKFQIILIRKPISLFRTIILIHMKIDFNVLCT